MTPYLSGVPKPFLNESLASWIQRVCQIYDLTLDRFHETFATSGGSDPDLCLTSNQLPNVAKMCGLQIQDFDAIKNCFCRLAERQNLQRLLLTRLKDGYTYQFCSQCWLEDKIPYFRLEWRFKHSKYCLIHKTELQANCPSCGRVLAMHRALLGGTYRPPPVPHLATCLYCRTNLRLALVANNDEDGNHEAKVTKNIAFQKALISAVIHNYFFIQPLPERWNLDGMLALIEGVGLETPDEKSTAVLNQFEQDDLDMLRNIVRTSLRGPKWLMPGHPKRRNLARTAFQFWSNKIYPSADDY